MNLAMVRDAINVIVAPVVMITSCAILLGGVLTRYAAINDRLRSMGHERFALIQSRADHPAAGQAPDPFTTERLGEISVQAPDLLRCHQIIRDSILALYLAILGFVASMFVIAAAALLHGGALATAALLVFLASTAALLAGVALVTVEVRGSHRALAYEIERIMRLGD